MPRKTDIDFDKVAAADLHRVCVHEVAHELVARHFGFEGAVTIWRNPEWTGSGSDWMGQKAWRGRFELVDPIPPGEVRRSVALAGSVAEELNDVSEEDIASLARWIQDQVEYGDWSLSASDGLLANGFDQGDIERTIHVVQSLFPQIIEEARRRAEAAIGSASVTRT